MQARPSRHAMSVCVCVCVCLSVTFVDQVKTNKHIFKIFSPSGSHTILVFFRTTRHGDISTGTPEWRCGGQKSRFWAYIWLHCLLLTLHCNRPDAVNTAAGGPRPPSCKLWHLSLVVSGGVDCGRRRRNVYDKKPQRYAKDDRTAHLTARSDKSAAYT